MPRSNASTVEQYLADLPINMGKSCLRFRKLDDVPLDVIGRMIASTPPEKLIAGYEAARANR